MADTIEARAKRADQVRQERRMKPGSVVMAGLKLHVPGEALDRRTYEYRWVNDTGNRVRDMYDQDWDPVNDPDGATGGSGEGSVPSKAVGTDDGGKAIPAVLMRKRKDWYTEDQKRKSRVLDETEQRIVGGKAHEKDEPALRGEGVYTPGGVNIIDQTARRS